MGKDPRGAIRDAEPILIPYHPYQQQTCELSFLPTRLKLMTDESSDEEAVFLAHGAGIDPEIALLGCHADRNENPAIKSMWESIATSSGQVF